MWMKKHSSDWDARVERTWNEHAGEWKENGESRWQTGSRKEVIPFLQKHIPTGKQIIDIGCGPGYSTHLLKHAGYTAFGVDISPEMIAHAKNTYADIPFATGDISNMEGIERDTYDAALVMNVIEWTETPIFALNELSRMMKRGGHLCIGILGPTAGPRAYSYERLYGKPVIQNTMMPWEFLKMAYENNWELIDTLYVWRKGVKERHIASLPSALQQALSFMTVFLLRNQKELMNDDG